MTKMKNVLEVLASSSSACILYPKEKVQNSPNLPRHTDTWYAEKVAAQMVGVRRFWTTLKKYPVVLQFSRFHVRVPAIGIDS